MYELVQGVLSKEVLERNEGTGREPTYPALIPKELVQGKLAKAQCFTIIPAENPTNSYMSHDVFMAPYCSSLSVWTWKMPKSLYFDKICKLLVLDKFKKE